MGVVFMMIPLLNKEVSAKYPFIPMAAGAAWAFSWLLTNVVDLVKQVQGTVPSTKLYQYLVDTYRSDYLEYEPWLYTLLATSVALVATAGGAFLGLTIFDMPKN